MGRPVTLRRLAADDIDRAIDWYQSEAGSDVALRFVDAVETALTEIRRHPSIGSPRYAHELALPGVRSWPVERFPYVVFYRDEPDQVDVWRVLHAQRDIPASLADPA